MMEPEQIADTGRHEWRSGMWDICMKCGIVKRADGKNKPCPGPVKVRLNDGGGDSA